MVTPAARSTPPISTSHAARLRPPPRPAPPRRGPPAGPMAPFPPTISIVLPSARGPCHRNVLPWADWVGAPATLAENSSRVRSIGGLLSGFRRPGWLAMTAEVSSPGPEGPWRSLRDGFAAGAARRDGSYGRPLGRDSRQPLDTAARALVGSIFLGMTVLASAAIHAPRGPPISWLGWHQEAALRMLMNTLDPAVAERPEELIVYGGGGKAARNWDCYEKIVATLRRLENDEALLVQSGKPVGVFRTREEAPRVLIANAHLVPRWAAWDEFRRLDAMGLTMYGQMTAGSWIYIGTQGILQGTYETFAECARQYFGGTLAGRLVVTAGLGGMGGAQPLAATMNGAAFLGIEVDPARIRRRVETGYCDRLATDLDEALALVLEAKRTRAALSVGLVGNVAEVMPELVRRSVPVDVVTDQTSAHDLRVGYIPRGMSLEDAAAMREQDPAGYEVAVLDSMALHVEALLALRHAGAVVFDYGNNPRSEVADRRGVRRAFEIPRFVAAFIRPPFFRRPRAFRL